MADQTEMEPGSGFPPEAEMFLQAIRHARIAFCVTDPNLPDNPIVFVNQAFLDLVGYTRDEVLGRNCRFLQGPQSDPAAVERVRGILARREVGTVELVNYRKDGSWFVNALQLGPIYDAQGRLRLFFGSQVDVTQERESAREAQRLAEAELRHRLMNVISVMSTLVRMTGREGLDAEAQIARINDRLQAVGRAHLLALARERQAPLRLSELAEVVLKAYAPDEARSFELQGPDVKVRESTITPLTLALHELAANAVKHGAFSRPDGGVALSWTFAPGPRGGQELRLRWVEQGGPPVAVPERESGSAIVKGLLRAAQGGIRYEWRPDGLVAEVRLPAPARD
jgi:PAS domain S-box-containing protein